jgi:2-dehydro-3-deoxyglucarate aldolase
MSSTRSIRAGLAAGETLLGAGLGTSTPAMAGVYGDLGLDFAWLDLEHSGPSPYDSTALEPFVDAAELAGVDLLVRLPNADPSLVRKTLDAGVRTVLLPRVTGPEEVRRAVEASRFDYDGTPGERGIGSARSSRWGGRFGPDYADAEDAAVTVGAMVEHRAAIDSLEEILAVPGLGFAFLGHWDLAASMGERDPGVASVQRAIETYEEACRSAGVPFGRNVGSDATAVRSALDRGHRMLLVGDEIGAARSVFGSLLSAVAADE